jgi:hypothetical protein
MIDAGANLVIGQGAHLLQGIERYRDRWILYNLGNFMFNSPGRYQKKNVPPFSLVALLGLQPAGDGVLLSIKLYPIFTDNLVTGYQSRPVTQSEFRRVHRLILDLSPAGRHLEDSVETGADTLGQFFALDGSARQHLSRSAEQPIAAGQRSPFGDFCWTGN